ncbi:TetR/AcrR family transcriptional regulator [Pseudoxanthomonas sp. SGNA-20]|jgi:Transcriptional regulator|uniref:TetR family transcriptional regulator n=1 Tax=Pseudoxanthomonas taiwanensis J19 TaxID=935569 RepID=A0A562DZ65_9GAMM|nr:MULTISPECIES: TetR/AcrR family transcriptional regulator [Pseudoxanthomonas]RRN56513.1 TetR/AcrR family transcriptional regulator [Pseudoxanthomonas sp. SGNA-20]RRN79699.1 TetR/AcrR family transcriptional regulator [Pseudoxanthomonas sp. SGD-10]TWH14853.1 TetR family transcriptional regulator [Pseudoxanthomonas taiwanensis J19]
MTTNSRRRGAALDEAILEAAWAELIDNGYAGFTLEGVARRAGTSRPVLSRRWAGSADLAVAAMRHYIAQNPIRVPDLGNVRAELVRFLREVSDRRAITIARVLFGMRDYFIETSSSVADLRKALHEQLGTRPVIDDILERGIRRGEIDPRKLTARRIALPLELVSHEALMTLKPVPAAVIAEILDTIFLPLVAADRKAAAAW